MSRRNKALFDVCWGDIWTGCWVPETEEFADRSVFLCDLCLIVLLLYVLLYTNVTVYSLYNVFKCPLFLPIDFYRGPVVSQVRLAGLEHVIMVTATEGKILIRNYRFIFIALVRIMASLQETVSFLLYKYSVDLTPDFSERFKCFCAGEF